MLIVAKITTLALESQPSCIHSSASLAKIDRHVATIFLLPRKRRKRKKKKKKTREKEEIRKEFSFLGESCSIIVLPRHPTFPAEYNKNKIKAAESRCSQWGSEVCSGNSVKKGDEEKWNREREKTENRKREREREKEATGRREKGFLFRKEDPLSIVARKSKW